VQQPLFTRTDAALLVIISGPMVWRCTAHKRWKTCRCCWPVSHANGRIVGAHLQHYAMPSHRSQEMPGLLVRAALFTRTDVTLLAIISGPMAWHCTARTRWRACRCCWPFGTMSCRYIVRSRCQAC